MPQGAEKASWLTPAMNEWNAVFGTGSFPFGKAARALQHIYNKGEGASAETIGLHLQHYLSVTPARFVSLPRFAETFAMWNPLQQELLPPLVDSDGVLSV